MGYGALLGAVAVVDHRDSALVIVSDVMAAQKVERAAGRARVVAGMARVVTGMARVVAGMALVLGEGAMKMVRAKELYLQLGHPTKKIRSMRCI